MNRQINTIRLRIAWKTEQINQDLLTLNRERFWAPIREEYSRYSIDELEAKLVNQFSNSLRDALVNRFIYPWEALHDQKSIARFEEQLQRLSRLIDDVEQRIRYEQAAIDERILSMVHDAWNSITEFIRFKRENIEQNKIYSDYQEQLALLKSIAKISFSAKIIGYSSVTLGIDVGGVSQLANIFENDFDAFQVFLDSYIPDGLSSAIPARMSERMTYDLQIPNSIKEEFTQKLTYISDSKPPEERSPEIIKETTISKARKNAEWIWILSNTSLVVPVFLALAVVFFASNVMRSINVENADMLKQAINEQKELIKQNQESLTKERERLFKIQSAQDEYILKRLQKEETEQTNRR